MSLHFANPTDDDTLPAAYRAAQRRAARAERRALALSAAKSAGVHDARGLIENAESDWRDVEDLVGLPVPRAFRRARRAAEKAHD